MTRPFEYALLDGELLPFDEARLSLAHPVFLTSFGVYETVKVDRGRPFHLPEHLQRLQNSARWLSLPLPPFETLLAWGRTLLRALPPASYTIRILALGDTPPGGETLVVYLPVPTPTYPPDYYTGGAKAITFPGERALPQCKSLNTLINHLARRAARSQGAIEAILTHHGEWHEGARSNVFVVEAETGRLLTPPEEKVLSGITRDIVIQVMQDSPHPVHQTPIPAGLPIAEMFITSTSMHVLPITTLNGQPVGEGRVGPVTKEAMSRFNEYYAKVMARS
ncbi:MAG: hypothetical protein D6796_10290 [Caldilineae bacterium]|nr:MAG: hypothetical protein D6796_10290 [Caldilineae bacterium]